MSPCRCGWGRGQGGHSGLESGAVFGEGRGGRGGLGWMEGGWEVAEVPAEAAVDAAAQQEASTGYGHSPGAVHGEAVRGTVYNSGTSAVLARVMFSGAMVGERGCFLAGWGWAWGWGGG